MRLPQPRGAVSTGLFALLGRAPQQARPESAALVELAAGGPLSEADLHISLFGCYALHYQGFDDVDAGWEWDPGLLALRGALEGRFERRLRRLVTVPQRMSAQELPRFLMRLGVPASGPSLADHMRHHATMDHFREFAVHRSLYNLMEADPHSWALPRVTGAVKSALVQIQADEYGNGIPGRLHSDLFRDMMSALGLDAGYGAYVDRIPPQSLALTNVVSYFGLHRRWRGALLGNLAVSEIGSSHGNRQFSLGLARLDAGSAARLFYDEHVEADAVHEQVAAHSLCGVFAREHPGEIDAVLFGALASRKLKQLSNELMLSSWRRGVSSLGPAAAAAVTGGGHG